MNSIFLFYFLIYIKDIFDKIISLFIHELENFFG
jgi:hypothetical protein